MKLATEIGELVIPPNLFEAKFLGFRFVPRVIEVERAGILAPVRFLFSRLSLLCGSLSGLSRCRLLLHLVQFGDRYKDRQLDETVLSGFVARSDEDLGIKMGIVITRNLSQLQGVFVSVIGDYMHVRSAACYFRLDADKAASYVPTIEHPIHGVPGKDVRNLLLFRKQNQS